MMPRCRRLPRLLLFTAGCAVVGSAAAAPLRVDFSVAGRSDSIAPGYEQWVVPAAESDRQSFDAAQVTIRASAGQLQTTWWKGAAVDGARMSVDGITAGPDRSIELRFRGLTPGRHSLVTYHNWSELNARSERGTIDVLLNDQPIVRGLKPTRRAASDDDAATGYLEFEATAGAETVVTLHPSAGASAVLTGFALGAGDPRRQALKPQPAHGDEHADADDGELTLTWTPAPAAATHHLYHGTNAEAVAQATPGSRQYVTATSAPRHVLTGVADLGDHFWRIDTVDAAGAVTRGEVWRFRPRRLAFPEAEGYGRFAAGGRGGRVFTVTTLADHGPGSLREAVEAEGPRTVVFGISGLITLESRLTVRNPYLTVAGQTAPGKGITLRGYNFGLLGTHDVIVRHLRVRPGNIAGVTLDGMGMASTDHSIIDHASISWTLDEAFSSRGGRNITLQHTLISEALNIAGHKKYRPGTQHGYAASISGRIGRFHHNLLAHNSGRNWSLAGGLDNAQLHAGWLDIRNNVVYNWQNRTTDGGAAKVNFVNNYYRPGPATKVFHLLKPERNNIATWGPQDYYVEGNVMEGHVGADDRLGGVLEPEPHENFIVDEPFFPSFVETHSARAAYKRVLSDVGTTQPMLDDNDRRVIGETLDRSFTYRGSESGLPGIPDKQDDVGGWEEYPEIHRAADWDNDGDGLPDWWEALHGLDSHSPADAQSDADGNRYTNLEDYLNWMGRPHHHTAPDTTLTVDLAEYTRGFTAGPSHRIDSVSPGQATLLPDGHTLRFNPAAGFQGLARVVFTVTDREGDQMTRELGIAVH